MHVRNLLCIRPTFVRGPVKGGVSVDVCKMVERLHAQQIGGRGRFSKHAGGHQRSQAFEVGGVHCHTSLQIIKN